MSSFYSYEKCLEYLNKWLESPYDQTSTKKQFLKSNKDEEIIKLVEMAFLEGFEAGRKRLNQENWELWNQK